MCFSSHRMHKQRELPMPLYHDGRDEREKKKSLKHQQTVIDRLILSLCSQLLLFFFSLSVRSVGDLFVLILIATAGTSRWVFISSLSVRHVSPNCLQHGSSRRSYLAVQHLLEATQALFLSVNQPFVAFP